MNDKKLTRERALDCGTESAEWQRAMMAEVNEALGAEDLGAELLHRLGVEVKRLKILADPRQQFPLFIQREVERAAFYGEVIEAVLQRLVAELETLRHQVSTDPTELAKAEKDREEALEFLAAEQAESRKLLLRLDDAHNAAEQLARSMVSFARDLEQFARDPAKPEKWRFKY